ncbi:hypothetical protein [Streptomyces sp. NPDC094149]
MQARARLGQEVRAVLQPAAVVLGQLPRLGAHCLGEAAAIK